MSDTIIKIEGVSKKYCRSIKHTMFYGATDLTRSFLGLNQKTERLRDGEFWAVDDVSFKLKRGETLGIIGPNGSGKSTLLKLLNGIFMPDKGRIEIKGRVGALIEVGAGFHPMLTGRENIYVNGAILGMGKKEIDKKFDEIVEFADIGDFLDAPVKHYSSGMLVRLGFAVAAHSEPDILLIDEVLAVGDMGFRAKCYNKISNIMENTAIIIVSHSIPMLNRYCKEIMVLNQGSAVCHGNSAEAIEKYYSLYKPENAVAISDGAKVESLVLLNAKNEVIDMVEHSSLLRIKISAQIDHHIKYPIIIFNFINRELQIIALCKSKKGAIENKNGSISALVDISPFILNPGDYKISLLILDEKQVHHLAWYNCYWNIKVKGESKDYGGAAVHFMGKWT